MQALRRTHARTRTVTVKVSTQAHSLRLLDRTACVRLPRPGRFESPSHLLGLIYPHFRSCSATTDRELPLPLPAPTVIIAQHLPGPQAALQRRAVQCSLSVLPLGPVCARAHGATFTPGCPRPKTAEKLAPKCATCQALHTLEFSKVKS